MRLFVLFLLLLFWILAIAFVMTLINKPLQAPERNYIIGDADYPKIIQLTIK